MIVPYLSRSSLHLSAQKAVDTGPHRSTFLCDKPMTHRSSNITVHIPGPLRGCCSGEATLALAASSLRGVLTQLEQRHPALHRSVCDETGAVRRHVNLFINTDHIRDRGGLDAPLAPGDEVIILPAVSGG